MPHGTQPDFSPSSRPAPVGPEHRNGRPPGGAVRDARSRARRARGRAARGLRARRPRGARSSSARRSRRFEETWAAACCDGRLRRRRLGHRRALDQPAGGRASAPGDEVIVPAHTYIASALAVLHAGAVPVLCDVERRHRPARRRRRRGRGRARARPRSWRCTSTASSATCRRSSAWRRATGCSLFEDAAQAHGAACDGASRRRLRARRGLLVLPEQEPRRARRRRRDLHERRRARRASPAHPRPRPAEQGRARRARLQRAARRAAGGLPEREAPWARRRERDAAAPRRHLSRRVGGPGPAARGAPLDAVRVPPLPGAGAGARRGGREAARGRRRHRRALPARRSHEQPALRGHTRVSGDLRRAEAWAREELSLPMSPGLTQAEVEYAARACVTAVDVERSKRAGPRCGLTPPSARGRSDSRSSASATHRPERRRR